MYKAGSSAAKVWGQHFLDPRVDNEDTGISAERNNAGTCIGEAVAGEFVATKKPEQIIVDGCELRAGTL
jgi:hypothetical protein